MSNYIIGVERSETDSYQAVIVDNAEDHWHARLAAYYHIYGVGEQPSQDRLRELTSVIDKGGLANAAVYKNPWKK
jgi:hypothetical protein